MDPEGATTEPSSDPRRFYRGTQIQVRLGDRVRIRRGLRRVTDGTFCYVPGESRQDPRMGQGPSEGWVIKTDDGNLLSEFRLPCPLFPTGEYPSRFAELSKRILFLRRREPSDPAPESLLPPPPHSLMYYRDGTEILLGDRIRFRNIFRGWRVLEGTITYIPGLAPKDPDLDEGEWAYATDDGWFFGGTYCPGLTVKGFIFLRRGEGK